MGRKFMKGKPSRQGRWPELGRLTVYYFIKKKDSMNGSASSVLSRTGKAEFLLSFSAAVQIRKYCCDSQLYKLYITLDIRLSIDFADVAHRRLSLSTGYLSDSCSHSAVLAFSRVISTPSMEN